MRFSTALILASASLAVSQTTTAAAPSSTSECEAQNIVDACRTGIESQIDKCEANDWMCLCDNYTNLLTCYNNCPDSQEKPPVQNQVTQYCNAAAPLSSASIASAKSAGVTAAPSATSAASQTATGTDAAATGFGSGTASATGAENTGAAGALAIPIGGVFAALLALL